MARPKRDGGQPQARAPRGARQDNFRAEVARLHRQIFRANQVRINASVTGYTKTFRQYEREYARYVQTYQRRANVEQLRRALLQADIVYVGDYHTLAQAQRSYLRLLRMLPEDGPVILALEFVQGRMQRALDAYLAEQIDEGAFLRSIKHHSHWVFGTWPQLREVLALAKERGWHVIGIDSAGRGSGRSSLRTRDKYAARRIVQAMRARPGHRVMVLMGELHIAPVHLPREVEILAQRYGATPKRLILYQNCERIYAALQARGIEHETALVRVATDAFCMLNTPPIVCQQSFLNWLYLDEDGAPIDEPEQTFKEYVRLIASFFDLPVGDAVDDVELTGVVDLSFLSRLRRRGDFSAHDMQMIRRQILAAESYYIPRAKMVYLGNLSVNHVSEEATHFLRHVCADMQEPKLLVDAFYARCLEEALGFLGSKVINHKRKGPDLQHFQKLSRARNAPAEQRRLARWLLLHVRMESGQRVRGLGKAYEANASLFNILTHLLGYRLGDHLYYGLVQGQLKKSEVRDLFFDSFDEEGTALATYLYLVARTAKVRIPDAFENLTVQANRAEDRASTIYGADNGNQQQYSGRDWPRTLHQGRAAR